MVKISLQMKATLENVEELYTSHQTYSYSLKVKCLNCGEASDKWHDVSESETFPTKTGKSETNFYSKCKLCGRENSMDIIQGSNGECSCKHLLETVCTFGALPFADHFCIYGLHLENI